MKHVSDLMLRLVGPLFFSAAFIACMSNYDAMKQLLNTVKAKFVEGAVYEQSNVDADDRLYAFNKDGSYEVSGAYLAGILSGEINECTIVIGDKFDYYQKLVINPELTDSAIQFTTYKQSLSATGVNTLKPVSTGAWVAGQSVDLNKVISYSSKYKVTVERSATNAIMNVTYTKI